MATLITPDGDIKTIVGKNGVLSIDQMQDAVKGYYTFAPTYGRENVVVNEEGALLQLPYNKIASQRANQDLFGNVLFCSDGEIE